MTARMRAAPPDSLTGLTTKRPLATKRIIAVQNGPPKIESYGKAQRFAFDTWPVSNFDELASALASLQPQSRAFIVCGKPAEGIDRSNSPRRLKPRKRADGTVEPATLLLQARFWLALDMDSIPCPPDIDRVWDVDAIIEHLVGLLPEEFHGCSVFWSLTSGHTFKPGICARLWFWLDRPLSEEEIKIWLAPQIAAKVVDPAIFNPIQAIYTAAPIFVGMHDPLPQRFGTWSGHSDAVEVPIVEKPQRKARAVVGTSGTSRGDGGGYAAYRARIGNHEGGDNFHRPVKSAVAAFIGEAGTGADTAWLRDDLEAAIREAPRDPGKHSDSYVETRVADLDTLIAAISEMQAAKEAPVAELCEPTYPAPLGSVAEARKVIEAMMRDIVDQVRGYRATLAQLQEDDEHPTLPA